VRRFRSRRWLAAAGLVLTLAAVLAIGAAYAYARSQRDVVARGIHVGTIDLGGLSAGAARIKLEQAYRPLGHPLLLRYGGGRLVLTARQAKLSLDPRELVARALDLSRRPWFLPRAWRELTGGRVKANLRPRIGYSRSAVERVVRELQRRIRRPPVNATLVPSFDRLALRRGHRGVAVAAGLLRTAIIKTLVTRQARRLLEVPIRHPRPGVTPTVLRRRYPSFITIDRAAFRLRVYSHLRFVRGYPIAVGQLGLQTPAGLYHIQNKVVDPSWLVPFSSWTGSLAGQVIPPGPDDPLKARWLGIFNGAGIHGTDETWSIGHSVSHGCVRMTIPDVIDLYDRVRVGTPVYIGD
jgi:L,D-transpeptidase catalytic domain/Putative peptidoglycan binding domain